MKPVILLTVTTVTVPRTLVSKLYTRIHRGMSDRDNLVRILAYGGYLVKESTSYMRNNYLQKRLYKNSWLKHHTVILPKDNLTD